MRSLREMFQIFRSENNLASHNAALEKVFSVLEEMTGEKSVLEDFKYKLSHIRHSDPHAFIELYLDWEKYLINRHSLEGDKTMTLAIFRKKIAENSDLAGLPGDLKIIFLNEKEQFIRLCEEFLNEIASYVVANLGPETLEDIHRVIISGTNVSNIKLEKNSFNFEEFNAETLKDVSYSKQRLVSIFKVLFEVLSERIEVSFGAEITKKLFNDIYSKIQNRFSSEISGEVLQVIPERVLSLDEWLSKLSKTELESRVKEKTNELEGLTTELEKKVEERTKELQVAFEALKVLDARKTEFMYLIAHQMRTPIVSIKWALSMLKEGDLGKMTLDQIKVVGDAWIANEVLNKTISEILLADDIINAKIKYEKESIDLVEIVKKTTLKLQEVALKRNIRIDHSKLLPNAHIIGDKGKIEVVLQSVLDNAVRYSAPEAIVYLEVLEEGNFISLKVTDNGIGIPKDSFDRIGERFYRADNALKQNTYGTGLGIYIVKNIIEGLGGKLTIQSNEGSGTEVTLTFVKGK